VGSRRECTWILGLDGFRVIEMPRERAEPDSRLQIRVERRGIRRQVMCRLTLPLAKSSSQVIFSSVDKQFLPGRHVRQKVIPSSPFRCKFSKRVDRRIDTATEPR
jgi:hypothetical protein